MSLLIRDAGVLTIADDGGLCFLPRHDIFVEASRISRIAPTGQLPVSAGIEVVEARGQIAMPGLINCHAHVPMVIFRGLAEDVCLEKWFNDYIWPLESNLQEEDVYWGMLLGLAEMIEAGVTCVADHYFFMDRAAEAVQQAGTRAALGWAVFGSQGEAGLARTAEFIKRWRGGADGRITTWMAPHAPYTCDDEFLKRSAAYARDLDVGIHIHISETRAQAQALQQKRGLTPIQLLDQLGLLQGPAILAHAVGATEDDCRLMAARNCGVAHCPKTYLKLAMGIAPVVQMRKAGVRVGLGTDGVVSNNTLDVWESMRLMALLQKEFTGRPEEMPLAEVLRVATRESAQVLQLDGQIGALAPGYLADIILVDVSGPHHQPLHNVAASLVYAARAGDVQTMIVHGRVVMRDRRILTFDKVEVVEKVGASVARLARRVPTRRIQLYAP